MSSKKQKAALLLGGNIGDTEGIFKKAKEKLDGQVKVAKISSLYRTEAWGMEDANDFLNQVLIVETTLSPRELLLLTTDIEREMGRGEKKPGPGYESRTLDIDILLYSDQVVEEDSLVIPHPKMHLRNFTLVPLSEVAGSWVHPVFRKNVDTLRQESPDPLIVKKI